MAQKTKATMPGRQCSTESREQNQHTRGNAGGQSLSAPVITGTTALALLTSPNGGCLFLHTSYGVAQTQIERNTGKPRSFERYMAVVYRDRLNFAPADFVQPFGYFGAFLQWLQFSRVVTSLSHSFLELGGSFPSKSAKLQVQNAGSIHPNYLPSSRYSRKPYRIIAIHVLGKDLGRISFLSHKFRMCNKNALSHLCASSFSSNRLLGSMPRCCNSLRIIRLIQAASDSSPSCCWACSISSRNSGSSLNWNGGLPRLSFLCVDTSITPDVMCLCVMTHYIHVLQIATPRSAGTLPRRLTKPLYEVTIMAELQHTQTHPKFTWLFLATPKSHPDCSPVVLRFDTDTEENARAAFPGWEMVFAAKIRAEAPCRVAFFDYNPRRGWAFDSASDREVVGHD